MIVLQSLAAFLLVLGPLIFIHELGHFLVAKWLRIGVPVFSLGIGPRLFGFGRGGTDYRISALPLGGYVRLEGDEADEHRRGRPSEFLTRPRWQRFLVFVAGATFNVILAFVAMWFLFAVYGTDEVPDPRTYPTIRSVEADSPAERAGLRGGDVLIRIGERTVQGTASYRDAYNFEIALAPGAAKPVEVERDGERTTTELVVGSDPTYGHGAPPGWSLSWGVDDAPVIVDVQEGSPAEAAGLQAGDRVVSAGDLEPVAQTELLALLESHPGLELRLGVEREGERDPLSLTVVPEDRDGEGKIGAVIGLPTIHRDFGVLEAAGESFRENVNNSLMLFHVIKRMVTREVPLKSVSGPIGIAQYARQALFASPRQFIWLLGFFSLQLGILNLLPIPVLDGGHIAILSIEGLLRRDLSVRLKERVTQVGLAFLLVFMSLVIYLDISKL